MFYGELPPDIPEEKLQELTEKIEADCSKMGLYLAGIQLVTGDGDPDSLPVPTMLLATFQVGTVAYADRTVAPEEDAVGDEVRRMEIDLQRSEWEEARKYFRDEGEDGPFFGLR